MAGVPSVFPIMDFGSWSSSRQLWKYDVFVSFRGLDTRRGFTSHLLAALKRKGINAFIDDAEKGMELAYMLKAIENSRILIVVLSRRFANSSWCLDELTRIMEIHDSEQRTVLSVFYHVDPKNLASLYEEAFARHRERDIDKVQSWEDALQKETSGLEVNDEPESLVIEYIVSYVMYILGEKLSSLPADFLGMESRTEQLMKFLDLESNEVRVVGIHGMIGIGKTTLARVAYENIFHKFDAACFLSNISEVSKRHNGLSHLQEKFIRRALDLEDLKIRTDQEGTILLRTRLRRLKILLVLDDVDHSQQLEKLAGNVDWFGEGTRVIVTTRDVRILKKYRLRRDKIYKVEPLRMDEAHKLFCRKAFKCDNVREGHEELTSGIVEYANGNPCAIESLASSLLEQSPSEWSGISEIPDRWIMRVFRKGFDGLSPFEKEILLDVACFFVGKNVNDVKEILKDYKFDSEIEIKHLVEKSFMTLSRQGIICMDGITRKMGRDIVHQESPNEPGRRSRLWLCDDFQHIRETDSANVEALVLNGEDFSGLSLSAKVLSKMIRLRLLIIENVRFSGSLHYLSNSLIFVSWDKYPFAHLPSSFEPQRVVKLLLHESHITQLWDEMKTLPNLRMMSLRHSKDLTEIPDLQGLSSLEQLDLEGCSALLHIHSSIERLAKLTSLNLRDCARLTSIPLNLFRRESIQFLEVAGCTAFAERSDLST